MKQQSRTTIKGKLYGAISDTFLRDWVHPCHACVLFEPCESGYANCQKKGVHYVNDIDGVLEIDYSNYKVNYHAD